VVSLATETLHEDGITLSASAVDALAGTFAKVVEEAQKNLTGRTSLQDGAKNPFAGRAPHRYHLLGGLPGLMTGNVASRAHAFATVMPEKEV